MTDVNATLLDNTDTQDNDANYKEEKKRKEKRDNKASLIFIIVVLALAAVALIVVLIVYFVVWKPKDDEKTQQNDDDKKEGFSASNSISNEYDYVNSVIYATLGDLSGLEKINANAIAA